MSKRASWKDLERDREIEKDPDHIVNVFKRIGETSDGILLRKWLFNAKLKTAPPLNMSDSALRDDAANRRIALMFYNALERPGDTEN